LATESAEGIRDFQDLEVWKEAMDLGERVYRLTWTFPRQETYGLAAQLQRASVSIPSNIAEGRMRGSLKDFAHFITLARGSLAEVRTQLIFAQRLEYTGPSEITALLRDAEILARRLNALRRSLQARLNNSLASASIERPASQNLKPNTQNPSDSDA
jgi:four helix bundle protein